MYLEISSCKSDLCYCVFFFNGIFKCSHVILGNPYICAKKPRSDWVLHIDWTGCLSYLQTTKPASKYKNNVNTQLVVRAEGWTLKIRKLDYLIFRSGIRLQKIRESRYFIQITRTWYSIRIFFYKFGLRSGSLLSIKLNIRIWSDFWFLFTNKKISIEYLSYLLPSIGQINH